MPPFSGISASMPCCDKAAPIVTIQHSYGAWSARRAKSHVDMTEQTVSRSFPLVIPSGC